MDTPQNHIWGPALWMILHSTAERIGTKYLHQLPQEEIRLWTTLLNSLKYSLPCPHCKKHYTSYLATNPIMNPFTKDNIRNWLFQLHNQVNERTGKNNKFIIEQLSELYDKPFCFTDYIKIIIQQMIQSIKLGWSSRNDIQKTIRILEEMKRFYDFF